MRKGLIIVGILCFILSSCNFEGEVKLIGDNKIEVNYGSEFMDEGVKIPEGYTFYKTGNVDLNSLGNNVLTYHIINAEGKIIETLIRIVDIVDNEAPVAVLREDLDANDFFYNPSDAFVKLSDNYYETSELIITCDINENVNITDSGKYDFIIIVEDPSLNKIEFQITANFEFDFYSHVKNTAIANELPYTKHIQDTTGREFILLRWEDIIIFVYENGYFSYSVSYNDGDFNYDVSLSGDYRDTENFSLSIHTAPLPPNIRSTAYIYNVDCNVSFDTFHVLDSYYNGAEIEEKVMIDYLNQSAENTRVKMTEFFIELLGISV